MFSGIYCLVMLGYVAIRPDDKSLAFRDGHAEHARFHAVGARRVTVSVGKQRKRQFVVFGKCFVRFNESVRNRLSWRQC